MFFCVSQHSLFQYKIHSRHSRYWIIILFISKRLRTCLPRPRHSRYFWEIKQWHSTTHINNSCSLHQLADTALHECISWVAALAHEPTKHAQSFFILFITAIEFNNRFIYKYAFFNIQSSFNRHIWSFREGTFYIYHCKNTELYWCI